MDLADQELIAEFVIESQEGLTNVESQMLEIEAGGENIDTDLVNSVFRTMHSIKGSAGFLGLDRIGALAHGLEEVLDDMRNREVVPSSELVSSVLRASDFMTELIDAVESSEEADVTPFIEDLQKLRTGTAEAAASEQATPPAAEAPQESASDGEVTQEPANDGAGEPLDDTVREFLIECLENLDKMDLDLVLLEKEPGTEQLLRNVFRTIHTIKGGAGFLGLTGLEKLTHAAENALSKIRSGELAWDTDVASALLATVDKCREGLELVEASGSDSGFEAPSVIQQLLDLDSGATGDASDGSQSVNDPTAKTAATQAPRPKTPAATTPRGKAPAAKAQPTSDQQVQAPRAESPRPKVPAAKGPPAKAPPTKAPPANDQRTNDQRAEAPRTKDQRAKAPRTNAPRTSAPRTSAPRKTAQQDTARRTKAPPNTARRASAQGATDQRTNDQRANDQRAKAPRTTAQQDTAQQDTAQQDTARRTKAPSDTARRASAQGATDGKPESTSNSVSQPPATAPAKAATAAPTSTKAPTTEKRDQPSASDSTIRVDVSLLDKLMTRVGELVLARNQILQYTNCQEDPAFVSTAQRLNLITTEIQEDVMKTRMQPIGNVWAKFPRVVRDLSKQMGKQIRIEMLGKETELDKTIVEAIKDPLTHLIRNSVDHGIESPEQRVAVGKPAEGCLSLRAYHEGGHVNIEISDDGAGLNLDRIRSKAVEKGLINPDRVASMSEREAAQLILMPGFSTAEQVSNVSGRGVGMDVVKTNIERISGTIDVHSEPGKGTTIGIKIPLTLAIIPALVITNGENRYAIPQVSLLELVRLTGDQIASGIELVHNSPVYRLRGTLLPLVNLSDRLGLKSAASDSTDEDPEDRVVNIVVVQANDQRFGLIVDGVSDTEEIVVKPLSRQLKGISEYAGTTIMGDGTVALILDVAGLAASAGLVSQTDESDAQNSSGDANSDDQKQTLLIVDLGDMRRFALPTSMVARLERVARSKVEHAGGREVIQYRGAIMPLVWLAHVFGELQPCDEESEELQIIVYADDERTYGLVVNRIVDIVETNLRFHSTYENDDNLLGAAVIQDRVTDVLNMQNLAKHDSRSSRSQPTMS